MLKPASSHLKDAGLSASAIDEVILVGVLHVFQSAGDCRRNFWAKKPNRSVTLMKLLLLVHVCRVQ